MMKQRDLISLVNGARDGDRQAMERLIQRFMPAINRHSRRLGYEDARSDLIAWMVSAVRKYRG